MAIAEELKLVVRAEVGKAVSDMNRFTGATNKSADGLKKFALRIGATVASIYTLKKALNIAQDAAQVAAKADQIHRALDSMAKRAGTSATKITREMQKMSGMTIDSLSIMESASKAALLGIPIERLGELMQVARASATALGTDVGTMFNDLATGIGRQSKMILDNLGINISAEKAYQEYAETLGKTAAQLTEAERKQGFLNAVLKDGERIMKMVGEAGSSMTATEPWQMMTAAITDAKIALGEKLFPLFNQGALKVAEMVRDMTLYFSNLPGTFEAVGNLIKIILKETFRWDMIKANVVDMAISFFEIWKKTVMLIPRLWWNSVKTIGKILGNLGEWIVSLFSNVWTRVRNAAIDKIGNLLGKIGIDIERKAIPAVMKLSDVFDQSWEDAEEGYAEMGKILWDTLSSNLNTYGKMLDNLAANYKDNPAVLEAIAQLRAIKTEAEAAAAAAGSVTGAAPPAAPGAPPGIAPPEPEPEVLKEYIRLYEILGKTGQDAKAGIDAATSALIDMEHQHGEEIKNNTLLYRLLGEEAGKVGNAMLSTFNSITSSLSTIWSNYYAQRMEGMDQESEEYKRLAREQAEAEKKMATFQAIVNTAAAVTKALASAPPPANAILAALAFATGMAQVAAIQSTPLPALAEGGIVTKPTTALVGEAGPEAIIPLGRSGGMMPGITIVQNIRGSILAERQLQGFALRGLKRAGRGY